MPLDGLAGPLPVLFLDGEVDVGIGIGLPSLALEDPTALTATAEYIDDDSNRVEGSKAVGELLAKFFAANKGAKLQITPEGARTVAPGVVIEDGESVVTVPDKTQRANLIGYFKEVKAAVASTPAASAARSAESPKEGDWRKDTPGRQHRIDLATLPPAFPVGSVF